MVDCPDQIGPDRQSGGRRGPDNGSRDSVRPFRY
jgi:hypothetical protein